MLELVHTDMYEPFYVFAWKMWVFHHFIDKYCRFGYVHNKFDALDTFIEFKAGSDNLWVNISVTSIRLKWFD